MPKHEDHVVNDINAHVETGRSKWNRRKFLGYLGGAAATVAASSVANPHSLSNSLLSAEETLTGNSACSTTPKLRRSACWKYRRDAADYWLNQKVYDHPNNGDETRFTNRIGNYSKGLPHNSFGEVDRPAYESLLKACTSCDSHDFDDIILGGQLKLTSPQGGLALEIEGRDSFSLTVPPPPSIASAEAAGEGVENYWMAVLRDTNFADYEGSSDVILACTELNSFGADFKGPKRNGRVAPQTLFRDTLPGANVGPYISQFLWLTTPFGTESIERRQQTLLPNTDHLTNYGNWLAAQNGVISESNSRESDPTRRYIRNGRDLAQWVHNGFIFQAYLSACLIMLAPPSASPLLSGFGVPFNPGNPYIDNKTQIGFTTFGPPQIQALLCEVASRALKMTWHKKWQVHRRIRPEAWGGLVHNQVTSNRYAGIINPKQLNSGAVERVFSRYGTHLLPQVFPEGSPTHPPYTGGHAAVAGACVTILKAMFDTESRTIPNPVIPSPDGLTLVPYNGPVLTVEGELNKLASNISAGRNIAGMNWRSDTFEALKIGEKVAIGILQDQKTAYNEQQFEGFIFRTFDGARVVV